MIFALFFLLSLNFIGLIGVAWKLFDLSVEFKSTMRSTHQIVVPTSMAPDQSQFDKLTEESKKELEKLYDEFRGIQ